MLKLPRTVHSFTNTQTIKADVKFSRLLLQFPELDADIIFLVGFAYKTAISLLSPRNLQLTCIQPICSLELVSQ